MRFDGNGGRTLLGHAFEKYSRRGFVRLLDINGTTGEMRNVTGEVLVRAGENNKCG